MLKMIKKLFGAKKENTLMSSEYIEHIQSQTAFLESLVNTMAEETKEMKQFADNLNEYVDNMIKEDKNNNFDFYEDPQECIDKEIKRLQEAKENLMLFKEEYPDEYYKTFTKEEDYTEYNNVVSLSNYKKRRN